MDISLIVKSRKLNTYSLLFLRISEYFWYFVYSRTLDLKCCIQSHLK